MGEVQTEHMLNRLRGYSGQGVISVLLFAFSLQLNLSLKIDSPIVCVIALGYFTASVRAELGAIAAKFVGSASTHTPCQPRTCARK